MSFTTLSEFIDALRYTLDEVFTEEQMKYVDYLSLYGYTFYTNGITCRDILDLMEEDEPFELIKKSNWNKYISQFNEFDKADLTILYAAWYWIEFTQPEENDIIDIYSDEFEAVVDKFIDYMYEHFPYKED